MSAHRGLLGGNCDDATLPPRLSRRNPPERRSGSKPRRISVANSLQHRFVMKRVAWRRGRRARRGNGWAVRRRVFARLGIGGNIVMFDSNYTNPIEAGAVPGRMPKVNGAIKVDDFLGHLAAGFVFSAVPGELGTVGLS